MVVTKSFIPIVVANITSNTDKINALELIVPKIGGITEQDILASIRNISSNTNKVKCLSLLSTKINRVSAAYVLSFCENITSNSDKAQCVIIFAPKMGLSFDYICQIIENITSDSSKIDSLRELIKAGFKVGPSELLKLCENISSYSSRCDAVLAFDSLTSTVMEQDEYCQKLAQLIDDEDHYLKAAKKLKLTDKFVQKYKPEKKSISIQSILIGNDPATKPGVKCIGNQTLVADGIKTETIYYSDGSIKTVSYRC